MSSSDTAEHTDTLNNAATVTSSANLATTLEGAGIAAAETGAMDMAAGKGPIVAGADAAMAAAQSAGLTDRIAALEAHVPVIGAILGLLQAVFPHSTLGQVSMPAPAGNMVPATPPPAPHWDGHNWVLPSEPTSPAPVPTWDATTQSWKLPA